MSNTLEREIKYIAGVGEVRARLMEREVGVRTIGDLLMRFPYRYIDRTTVRSIGEINEAMESTYVQIRCRVVGKSFVGEGRKQRFVVEVTDRSGSAELLWFQGAKWIEKRIELNREYMVFGRPSFFHGRVSLAHPEVEPVEQVLARKVESGFQGIYPSTERLSQLITVKGMHNIVYNAWQMVANDDSAFVDPLPEDMRRRNGLVSLREAIYNIHFPQSAEALKSAKYRLKYDELLGVQLTIQARRTERHAKVGQKLLRERALENVDNETRRDDQEQQVHCPLHKCIGEKPLSAAHVPHGHEREKHTHLLGGQQKTFNHWRKPL
jgi:ATP-dependent DNA helicase RecG